MKKPFCLCTLVRNERVFLPIFLAYYKQFFDVRDIYILDHDTDDGSTNNLDVNVISITHNDSLDCTWMKSVYEEYQSKLLQNYEIVVFVDVDEILYTLCEPLDSYLYKFLKSERTHATCTSYELLHDIKNEVEWSSATKLFDIRRYWVSGDDPVETYDKTPIIKIPIVWEIGCHVPLNVKQDKDHVLFLLHLHRADFNIKINRAFEKIKNKKISKESAEKKWSWQNQFTTDQENIDFFNKDNNRRTVICEEHKKYFKRYLNI